MNGLRAKQMTNLRLNTLENLLFVNFFSITLIAALPRRKALRALKLINDIEMLNLTRRERKAFYLLIIEASKKPRILLTNPFVIELFAWEKVTTFSQVFLNFVLTNCAALNFIIKSRFLRI